MSGADGHRARPRPSAGRAVLTAAAVLLLLAACDPPPQPVQADSLIPGAVYVDTIDVDGPCVAWALTSSSGGGLSCDWAAQ